MRRHLATSLAVALALAFAVPAFAACTCPPVDDVATEYANSDLVFAGTAYVMMPTSPYSAWPDDNQWLFSPISRWKGQFDWFTEVSPWNYVVTPTNEADCSFPFVVGETYIVYAKRQFVAPHGIPAFVVTSCSRTAAYAENPDLAFLGPTLLPVPARASTWGALKSLYR